jgi:hypothetical protein
MRFGDQQMHTGNGCHPHSKLGIIIRLTFLRLRFLRFHRLRRTGKFLNVISMILPAKKQGWRAMNNNCSKDSLLSRSEHMGSKIM